MNKGEKWPGLKVPIVLHGDCVQVMKEQIEDQSVHAICTDPPYGINFLPSKTGGWDKQSPGIEFADQCYRVLKPGGHLIAFSANRTVHRLMGALEGAGFEIRDLLAWAYFSGFPKSMDISKAIDKELGAEREVIGENPNDRTNNDIKGAIYNFHSSQKHSSITAPATAQAKEWHGWGTNLKPAFEVAVLCRKPISERNIALNVLKHRCGGLNIDACRFKYHDKCWIGPKAMHKGYPNGCGGDRAFATARFDAVKSEEGNIFRTAPAHSHPIGRWPANIYQAAKPARSERDAGCSGLAAMTGADATGRTAGSAGLKNPRAGAGRTAAEVLNHHPTVKPLKIIKWMIKLITPKGGTVLDPYLGSGTTCAAAVQLGIQSIGIEKNPDYLPIISARIDHALEEYKRDHAQLSLLSWGGLL